VHGVKNMISKNGQQYKNELCNFNGDNKQGLGKDWEVCLFIEIISDFD